MNGFQHGVHFIHGVFQGLGIALWEDGGSSYGLSLVMPKTGSCPQRGYCNLALGTCCTDSLSSLKEEQRMYQRPFSTSNWLQQKFSSPQQQSCVSSVTTCINMNPSAVTNWLNWQLRNQISVALNLIDVSSTHLPSFLFWKGLPYSKIFYQLLLR